MRRRVLRASLALFCDRRAATAVEYGLLLGGIAVAVIAALFAIGDEVSAFFGAAGNFSRHPG